MVRDVCSKYIYDKCPAVAAVGEYCCGFCFCCKVRVCAVMNFSNPSFLSLSTRPHWAVAWLQQNAQCHVLAQVLSCLFALCVQRLLLIFLLNHMLLSFSHYCESGGLRIVQMLVWQHRQPPILSLLPTSLFFLPTDDTLVSYGRGRGAGSLHRSSSPGTDLQRGGESG